MLLPLLVLLPTLCIAASGPAAARKEKSEAAKRSFVDSAALYRAGDSTRAERALTATNHSKEGTGAWHLESAQRLYEMALYFRATRQSALSLQIAASALRQINPAVAKLRSAGDTRRAVMACDLEGMIHDSLLIDPKAAIRAYEQALRLNPNAARSQAELTRLTRLVETQARKR